MDSDKNEAAVGRLMDMRDRLIDKILALNGDYELYDHDRKVKAYNEQIERIDGFVGMLTTHEPEGIPYQRVVVGPDDFLVFKVKAALSPDCISQMKTQLSAHFGTDRIAILEEGIEPAVIEIEPMRNPEAKEEKPHGRMIETEGGGRICPVCLEGIAFDAEGLPDGNGDPCCTKCFPKGDE